MELSTQHGQNDHIIAYLKKNGFPVTEENYLALAYPDGDYPADVELPEEVVRDTR